MTMKARVKFISGSNISSLEKSINDFSDSLSEAVIQEIIPMPQEDYYVFMIIYREMIDSNSNSG